MPSKTVYKVIYCERCGLGTDGYCVCLPVGCTCADCAHQDGSLCRGFADVTSGKRVYCGWNPVRFERLPALEGRER